MGVTVDPLIHSACNHQAPRAWACERPKYPGLEYGRHNVSHEAFQVLPHCPDLVSGDVVLHCLGFRRILHEGCDCSPCCRV